MWKGSFQLTALLGALVFAAASGASAQQLQLPKEVGDAPNDFAWRLLAQHNLERDRKGTERLRWSSKLAREAQTWAEHLAQLGRYEHADYKTRRGAGENLWMGSAGYYGAEEMIDSFLDERRHYIPGTFPKNSRTGKWEDVGHYTQVIWPGTQEVGCAIAKGRENDFLVCRYWPAGNTIGVTIN